LPATTTNAAAALIPARKDNTSSEATEADDRINYNVAAAFRCETGDKELFEPADHWIHVTPQERSVI